MQPGILLYVADKVAFALIRKLDMRDYRRLMLCAPVPRDSGMQEMQQLTGFICPQAGPVV
jgi:hypothetical protein